MGHRALRTPLWGTNLPAAGSMSRPPPSHRDSCRQALWARALRTPRWLAVRADPRPAIGTATAGAKRYGRGLAVGCAGSQHQGEGGNQDHHHQRAMMPFGRRHHGASPRFAHLDPFTAPIRSCCRACQSLASSMSAAQSSQHRRCNRSALALHRRRAEALTAGR